eukprot:TRINITY_DN3423_c0_g1_i3.p1 TRINITY_DN3423_c0_g1~~TRINITY_DN3423_c0_g1_i3.p1  ORF type:complete len:258 (-),score=26.62 TRINITY_DN3423_c0_g1_i3:478-1251(-)
MYYVMLFFNFFSRGERMDEFAQENVFIEVPNRYEQPSFFIPTQPIPRYDPLPVGTNNPTQYFTPLTFNPVPEQAFGTNMNYNTDFGTDEPPLLEELGINFDHIKRKTFSVLNPFTLSLDEEILLDCDLAGPIVFALLLGFSQTLLGKWTFDYIYGFGCIGCISIYLLVNLMSKEGRHLDIYRTISILGYCLLPMVLLSVLSLVLARSTSGITAFFCILWCTRSSVMMFTQPDMVHQRFLIAYPLGLFYTCFALLTIF